MSRSTKDLRELVQGVRSNASTPSSSSSSAATDLGGAGNALASKSKKLLQLAQDDQELIDKLKKKVEQQSVEMEQREESIASLQRNFENLSSLYACTFLQ